MTGSLLDSIRKLTHITKEFSSERDIFEKILNKFSSIINSEIAFIDINGSFVFECMKENSFSLSNKAELKTVDIQLNEQLKNIIELKTDLSSDIFLIKASDKNMISEFKFTVSPVFILNQRLASIVLYRKNILFDNEELILLEFVTALTAVYFYHIKNEQDADKDRRINIIKSAMGTLSYSELEAIINIFNELEGKEGLLVASKIADKAGITRSVIVNALRKFESAGIIESRSLGMKGTYIKVLNEFLFDELDKLKK